MTYLLDANTVIALLKGNEAVRTRMAQYEAADIQIPSIVLHELAYGAYKSQRVAENLDRLNRLPFEILALDAADAARAGALRGALERAGTPIGPFDTLIAGQALARRLTLVTRNTREFTRVPDLAVEDWETVAFHR